MTADSDSAEERRLWADFYEATARVLEIMRSEGTSEAVLERVAAEQARADKALARIREIRRLRESASGKAPRS